MSTIDPVGPTPTPDSSAEGSGSSSSSSGVVFTDGISSSSTESTSTTYSSSVNIPPPEEWLSIVDFSGDVLSAINTNNSQWWQEQQDNNLRLQSIYQSVIADLENLLQLYNESLTVFNDLAAQDSTNQAAVNTLNQHINDYNNTTHNADVSATNDANSHFEDMLAATLNYNSSAAAYRNGSITWEQLQAAVSHYNTALANYNNDIEAYARYVNGRNTSSTDSAIDDFNNEANDMNDSVYLANQVIDILNKQLPPDQHLQYFSPQDYYGSSTALPDAQTLPELDPPNDAPGVSQIPAPQALPAATNTVQPPPSTISVDESIIKQYLGAAIEEMAQPAYSLGEHLQQQSAYHGFLQFFFQGTVSSLPTAYIPPAPRIYMEGSSTAQGAGSSVSLGTLISPLNSPNTPGVIQFSNFISEMKTFTNPLSPELVYTIGNQVNTALLQRLSLSSAPQAIALLGSKFATTEINSPAYQAALAFSLASQIAEATSSDQTKAAFTQLISKESPGISNSDLTRIVNGLTSSSKLILLGAALSQIAQALGIPGLPGQVLSTLSSSSQLPSLKTPLAATENETLSNPASVIALKTGLEGYVSSNPNILKSPLSSTQLQQLINQLVNVAIKSSQQSDGTSFQQSVQQQLVQEGVNAKDANAAASYAAALVAAEQQGLYRLDGAFTKKKKQDDDLIDTIVQEGIKRDVVTAAVRATDVASSENQRVRDVRDRLASELTARGVQPEQALLSSTTAFLGTTPTTFTIPATTLPELRSQLTTQAAQVFSSALEPAKAQAVAERLSTLVLGADTANRSLNEENKLADLHSLHHQLDRHLLEALKQGDSEYAQRLDDQMRVLTKPNINIWKFNQKIMEPGNILLYSIWTGLAYADRPMPSNFQKTVDFLI